MSSKPNGIVVFVSDSSYRYGILPRMAQLTFLKVRHDRYGILKTSSFVVL